MRFYNFDGTIYFYSLVENTILLFSEKYCFIIWWKICFYDLPRKYNFIVLERNCDFSAMAGKYDFAFWQKNDLPVRRENATSWFWRENTVLQYWQKNQFCNLAESFILNFREKIFKVLVKTYILRIWNEMW